MNRVRSDVPTSLDALAALPGDTLDALYRGAVSPTSMRVADGPLVGRMLAVRALDGRALSWVSALAAWRGFPWAGKSFASTSDREGTGINRVSIPGVLGRQALFPFHTRFGPSALDGAPALVLDYDLDDNPPYIRRIHDEVREIAPGLLFGPAMWKTATGPATVLWFALDARGVSA